MSVSKYIGEINGPPPEVSDWLSNTLELMAVTMKLAMPTYIFCE